MSNWNVGANWEYSRWLKNYARNCRITEPTNILPYAGEFFINFHNFSKMTK